MKEKAKKTNSEERRELLQFRGLHAPAARELEGGGHVIEGRAIAYGEESVPLYEWGYDREVIAAGAVTSELLTRSDVKMTMWHNRERLLARSNKGAGTLRLELREDGLWFSFDVPDTPDGQTALALVRRGDIAGASFTYWSSERNSVRYTDTADGILRTVERVDALYELTLASDPAYPSTSAAAREHPEGVRALLAAKAARREAALARRAAELAVLKDSARWQG